jgi:hypothetical protein
MKKYLYIIILLSLPSISFATSGACSSHGGVNCSAGAGTNDQAICNDGWTGSVVPFSDVNECKVSGPQCVYPTQTQPTCSLSDIQTQKQNALGTSAARMSQYGVGGSAFATTQAGNINSQYDTQYNECQSQWTIYQAGITGYNTCTNYNSQLLEKQQEQQVKNNEQQIEDSWQQSCISSYGPYAKVESNGHCSCQSGYDIYNNQCVPLVQYCPSVEGPGAIPASGVNDGVEDECACAPGYTKTQYFLARCSPIVQPQTSTQTNLSNIFGTTTKTSPPVHKPKPKVSPSLDNIFATTTASSTVSIQSTTTSSTPAIALPVATNTTAVSNPNNSFIMNVFGSIKGWFGKIF